jgi:CRP-like cAMP-binding protein
MDKQPVRAENLFSSFPQIRAELEQMKVAHHFKPGGVIFRSGELPIGLYIIHEGLVKLESLSESGSAHTLRLVGQGGVLGYRSLFADEPYFASAIAVENTDVFFVPKNEVMALFHRHPEVTLRFLAHLARDLRTAETKWVHQIDKGAPERVAESLLFLSEKFKHANWTGEKLPNGQAQPLKL